MTTHDWGEPVDVEHIVSIRGDAVRRSAGGVSHLALEVLAYALDEAAEGSTRLIVVTAHVDGSISVSDDGRGTDTRRGQDGRWIVKPVMATRDLRFFDVVGTPTLGDGFARSGMSVVTALRSWLIHTNVRADGAWTARCEHGIPADPPAPAVTGPTGTTVHFKPDPEVFGEERLDLRETSALVRTIASPARVSFVEA